MLEIHLYGKFREKAENKSPSANSVVFLQLKSEKTLLDILKRLDIDPKELGDCFIAGNLATPESKIPSAECRIGIFPLGMHLIDGGQHLKGHGYIIKEPKKKLGYW
ncbi:MAG: hypothetical protein ACFFB3_00895 [Candidatus Hodarchaeota archaeon]